MLKPSLNRGGPVSEDREARGEREAGPPASHRGQPYWVMRHPR